MIFERGSIRLIRLQQEHIELVRNRRNMPEIQRTMEYREYITPEMQQKWFEGINNKNNNYFLIEANGEFIGMISARDIDWDKNITNNGGIFIWNDKYFESLEVLNASLLLTDVGFYTGMEKNYIKILTDNKRSIAYNTSLGYRLLPGQDGIYNQLYELTVDDYFKSTLKIRKFLGLSDDIDLLVTPEEYDHYIDLARKMEQNGKKYRPLITVNIIKV